MNIGRPDKPYSLWKTLWEMFKTLLFPIISQYGTKMNIHSLFTIEWEEKGGASMRRFICAALAALYLTIPALAVEALPEESFSLSCTAAVVFSPLAYPGYNWMAQAVSDLSAANAPSPAISCFTENQALSLPKPKACAMLTTRRRTTSSSRNWSPVSWTTFPALIKIRKDILSARKIRRALSSLKILSRQNKN